jgi:hypothetical protein
MSAPAPGKNPNIEILNNSKIQTEKFKGASINHSTNQLINQSPTPQPLAN